MTDYNDGKWHGWNGGECPVHPETVVEYIWANGGQTGRDSAKAGYSEDGDRPAWSRSVKAFRVVKRHRDPREWWISNDTNIAYDSPVAGCVHVREVLE